MTKQKISSKVVRARGLAFYELEKFIAYVGTIDPELPSDRTIVLAASLLAGMPALFEENPDMLNHLKEMVASIKPGNRN